MQSILSIYLNGLKVGVACIFSHTSSCPGSGVEVGSSTPGLVGEVELDGSLLVATDVGEGSIDWRDHRMSSWDISEAAGELEVAGGIRGMGNSSGLKSQSSSEPLSLWKRRAPHTWQSIQGVKVEECRVCPSLLLGNEQVQLWAGMKDPYRRWWEPISKAAPLSSWLCREAVYHMEFGMLLGLVVIYASYQDSSQSGNSAWSRSQSDQVAGQVWTCSNYSHGLLSGDL